MPACRQPHKLTNFNKEQLISIFIKHTGPILKPSALLGSEDPAIHPALDVARPSFLHGLLYDREEMCFLRPLGRRETQLFESLVPDLCLNPSTCLKSERLK